MHKNSVLFIIDNNSIKNNIYIYLLLTSLSGSLLILFANMMLCKMYTSKQLCHIVFFRFW